MSARLWVYSLTVLAVPSIVSACPRCEVGVLARRQVLEQDFTFNLFLATLPFAAVLVASAISERIGKPR